MNELVPGIVRLPKTSPHRDKVKPAGNAPDSSETAKSPCHAPVTEHLPVYAAPVLAFGRSQDRARGGIPVPTVKFFTAAVADCVGDPLSVTLTVNELVPGNIGVPVIAAFPELKFSPVGNEPALIKKVSKPLPPVATQLPE